LLSSVLLVWVIIAAGVTQVAEVAGGAGCCGADAVDAFADREVSRGRSSGLLVESVLLHFFLFLVAAGGWPAA
jgi:hypothetical protein